MSNQSSRASELELNAMIITNSKYLTKENFESLETLIKVYKMY